MRKRNIEREEIDRKVEEHSSALQFYFAASAYFQSASLLLNSSTRRRVGETLRMPILTLLGIGYELSFKAWKRAKNGTIESMKGHDLLKLRSECIKDEIPCDLNAVSDKFRDKINSDFFGNSSRQQLGEISFEDHFYNLNAMYGRYPNLARYPVSQHMPQIDLDLLCAVGKELCEAIRLTCFRSTSREALQ